MEKTNGTHLDSLASLSKIGMGLIIAGAMSLSFGLWMTTEVGSSEGSPVQFGLAFQPGAGDAPPQAPLDPTQTPEPSATPEPTATPEPPTPTPEPPTPEPPTSTPAPPRPAATPRPPAAAPTQPPPPPAAPPAAPAPSLALSGFEQELFALHNAERSRAGLAPLRVDPSLYQVARKRAQDMAARAYFAHTSPSGETAFSIMAGMGYAYSIAGENIARNNFPDAQSAGTAMTGFLNSPTHRANILDARFTNVGIALAYGADGMKYWAVVFSGG